MIVLGLTGSIGMGKSTLAAQFKHLGVLVHEADACVHGLMQRNGAAFEALRLLFPSCVEETGINRTKLGRIVFEDPAKRIALEAVLHPLVEANEAAFLQNAVRLNADIAVLDIPLLFETHAETRVHYVVCATAPLSVQRKRVLARKGMTLARFEHILTLQMPDAEKRQRADFVVNTAQGRASSLKQLKRVLHDLRNQKK